ncbi:MULTISPECIES: hypothetical protein [unclassified Coleofasciculus]|uniref:hypothetical protein n=1 Tax=unclassified Coleofasciculus TaxID=2692782 RepID=UPI0018826340|nr:MULTISPECIES: hypothetical protein [unclassified Coleofasciculus]MBE9125606.1 hypothetical protein [Coleofasciculus sp. LEGE 07081]MBE9147320.1 hypothetical protein [Coleofasciculus sp. LEGE 07092]
MNRCALPRWGRQRTAPVRFIGSLIDPKPWVVFRLLPTQNIEVARYVNRQDADEHKRILSRFIPDGSFETIFDESVYR